MIWNNVTVKLGDLKPWEHNPRNMTKRQAQRLLKSWSTLGQFQTIAIGPHGEVYDGHQRLSALLAAHGAGYAVDARQSERELNDDERAALTLAANIPAGNWDWDKLAQWDSSAVQDWGLDAETLKAWQSDAANLAQMLSADDVATGDADAEPQIDKAAELNEKWQVKRGDLWRIGDHRLLCGDSTVRGDADRVMGGDVAELLFTSPPYADMREYEGDNVSVSNVSDFINAFSTCVKYYAVNLGIKREHDEIVEYWREYIDKARNNGFKFLSWNVWDKMLAGSVSNQSAMFAIEHEWIFILGKESKPLNRIVDKSPDSFDREKHTRKDSSGRPIRSRRQADGSIKYSVVGEEYARKNTPTVTQIPPEMGRNQTDLHPALMPVALPEHYINAMTNSSDVVADSFAGSGTTLVACQNLQRKCRAIEISPNYCAVILERMATAFPDLVIERIE